MTRGQRSIAWIFGSVILGVILVRAALPSVLEIYLERTLNRSNAFSASIDDVDLSILLGRIALQGVEIDQRHSKHSAARIKELVVDGAWLPLLRGRLIASINVIEPAVQYDLALLDKLPPPKEDWRESVRALFPVTLTGVQIADAKIRILDSSVSPPVEFEVNPVDVEIQMLTNEPRNKATVAATGTTTGNGLLRVQGTFLPLSQPPTFDFEVKATSIHPPAFNREFKRIGNFDLERGGLSTFMEIASAGGVLDGYIKLVALDLDVLGKGDRKDSPLNRVWEALVAAGGEILENQPREQDAAIVPITGRLENPSTDLSAIVLSIIRNAFVRAISPRLDNRVDLSTANKKKKTDHQ